MILNNILILRGSYSDIYDIKDTIEMLIKNKKHSKLYNATTKYMTKIRIVDFSEKDYLYNLKLTFNYSKGNIEELIQIFKSYPIEVIHMCENSKENVWIVNEVNYIANYRLIPSFAINEILLEYMKYKESAIILDNFSNIKYDQNSRQIVINEKTVSYDELLELMFNETLKGKLFYDILEQFIDNYYNRCINQYKDLYSINKVSSSNEEPSPIALFIVTFGIFAILAIIIKFMGYF